MTGKSIEHVVLAGILCCIATGTHGEPLPDTDLGPLTGIFGIPDASRGSTLVSKGDSTWHSTLAVASHSIAKVRANEVLTLDGESRRFALSYTYGVGDDLNIGIEIPYLWHESGSLDAFIDGWHDAFGFKARVRDARPRDLLEFEYADANGTLVDLRRNVHGPGDARIFAGWMFDADSKHTKALRLEVKLPTGDAADLLGSGGTDISLGIAGDVSSLWGNEKLSGFYRASVSYLGEPDLLADRYKSSVGNVAFGVDFQLHDRVNLNVQTRIRTAIYSSRIDNLGGLSLSMTFGGRISLSDRYSLMLSVGEDVKPATAPDVVFQIGLGFAPAR